MNCRELEFFLIESNSHVPCLGNDNVVKRLMPSSEPRETNPDHHID